MLRTEPCAIDRNCSIQLQISCSAALILEARLANRLTNQQTSQPTNKPTNKQANNQTRIIQVRQHGKRKVLAILDVYGFENVSSNSFEQLTTNYCNEKLHQLITEVVLKEEQEEYILEGLEWNQITYMDNTIVCDLIEKVPQTCFLPHTHTHTHTHTHNYLTRLFGLHHRIHVSKLRFQHRENKWHWQTLTEEE